MEAIESAIARINQTCREGEGNMNTVARHRLRSGIGCRRVALSAERFGGPRCPWRRDPAPCPPHPPRPAPESSRPHLGGRVAVVPPAALLWRPVHRGWAEQGIPADQPSAGGRIPAFGGERVEERGGEARPRRWRSTCPPAPSIQAVSRARVAMQDHAGSPRCAGSRAGSPAHGRR